MEFPAGLEWHRRTANTYEVTSHGTPIGTVRLIPVGERAHGLAWEWEASDQSSPVDASGWTSTLAEAVLILDRLAA